MLARGLDRTKETDDYDQGPATRTTSHSHGSSSPIGEQDRDSDIRGDVYRRLPRSTLHLCRMGFEPPVPVVGVAVEEEV